MKGWHHFISYSRFKQIVVSVCLIHGLLVFALAIHHLFTFQWRSKKPIVVHTIPWKPIPPSPVSTIKPSPTPQKTVAKTAPIPTPKKPTPEMPVTNPKILQEIAKSLDAIHFSPKKTVAAAPLPPPIEIHKPTELQPRSFSFEEDLILFLQSALELPELGDVKAKLTLDKGKFVSCEILDTKSTKNSEFLKKQLPQLDYPCFNDASQRTFTVTFTNVETR